MSAAVETDPAVIEARAELRLAQLAAATAEADALLARLAYLNAALVVAKRQLGICRARLVELSGE